MAGPVVIVDRSPQALAVTEFDGDPLVKVVRAEWSDHLMKWLGEADGADFLVPAPFQPHLLWTWLASELNAVPTAAPAGWALPYEAEGAGGVPFLSAAGWRCPATCVEPAHCPVLHAPRDWDLGDVLTEGALARGYGNLPVPPSHPRDRRYPGASGPGGARAVPRGGASGPGRDHLPLPRGDRRTHPGCSVTWGPGLTGVAQLAEHRSPKPRVEGSSPSARANPWSDPWGR